MNNFESIEAHNPNCLSQNREGDEERPPSKDVSRDTNQPELFNLRTEDGNATQDWWFAASALPLLAAFTGPLANVMSIAARGAYWRNNYSPTAPGVDEGSIGFPDPSWCVTLKTVSLVCGVGGNIFLLCNFTRRVRYIVALPLTLVLWYFAAGLLMGNIIAMNKYCPPHPPGQTYSQGFWYGILAAVLFFFSSTILTVNILGHFLGHYPQYFKLTDEQRNLILQTIVLCLWLTGGAGVFHKVCGWSYADALYFSDVTILTVGFGDFVPQNTLARVLLFPYAAGGIIILSLLVSSTRRFVKDLGHENFVKKHMGKQNALTLSRLASLSKGFHGQVTPGMTARTCFRWPKISSLVKPEAFNFQSNALGDVDASGGHEVNRRERAAIALLQATESEQALVLLLQEERRRFNAMRTIQRKTVRFTRYSALAFSILAFGFLWCVGAAIFWRAERKQQPWTYPESLYFCYVSLLTLGYGDFVPISNTGKPFFVVWSLVAVPTMTILVSNIADTFIASYKRGTIALAEWSVLPEGGYWRGVAGRSPWLVFGRPRIGMKRAQQKPVTEATQIGVDEGALEAIGDLTKSGLNDHNLAIRLALAIQETADDLKAFPPRRYGFEEWVEYARLIRFTMKGREELDNAEEDALIEWEILAEQKESGWLLDKLTESLVRYLRKQESEHVAKRQSTEIECDAWKV